MLSTPITADGLPLIVELLELYVNKMNVAIRAEPPFIDLGSLQRRPHVELATLRARAPVTQYAYGQYLVVGGPQVCALLGDPRARQIKGLEFLANAQVPDGLVARFVSDVLLLASNAASGRPSQPMTHALSRNVICAMRPHLRKVAHRIVADLPRRSVFDLGPPMAEHMPVEMIVAYLGLPPADVTRLIPHVFAAARAFLGVYPNTHHMQIDDATHILFDYVFAQLTSRQTAPRDDMLSAIVAEWARLPHVPLERLALQIMGLFVAGAEATRIALTMLLAQLLQRPHIWTALCKRRELISGAVAESLRFEPPVATVTRHAHAKIKIGDIIVPQGAVLRLSLMSAMRDPALYPRPDRFDIARKNQPVIPHCFGMGSYSGFAANLAPIVLAESLAAFLEIAPQTELISPPRLAGLCGTRQITPMHVYIP